MSILVTLFVTWRDLFLVSTEWVVICGLSYTFYIPVLTRIGFMALVSENYRKQIIIIIIMP